MSIYYSIGCDRCKEELFILSNHAMGMGPGADLELLPRFVEKHQDHVEELRVFDEYDPRYEDYADFTEPS